MSVASPGSFHFYLVAVRTCFLGFCYRNSKYEQTQFNYWSLTVSLAKFLNFISLAFIVWLTTLRRQTYFQVILINIQSFCQKQSTFALSHCIFSSPIPRCSKPNAQPLQTPDICINAKFNLRKHVKRGLIKQHLLQISFFGLGGKLIRPQIQVRQQQGNESSPYHFSGWQIYSSDNKVSVSHFFSPSISV